MHEIDRMAEAIRRVDGNHDLGAGALAEKLHARGFGYVKPLNDIMEMAVRWSANYYAALKAFEKDRTPIPPEVDYLHDAAMAISVRYAGETGHDFQPIVRCEERESGGVQCDLSMNHEGGHWIFE